MKQYRKKPVVIHAVQWTGDNLREVIDFTGLHPSASKWTWEEYEGVVKAEGLKIFTLEGRMDASVGDFIIKGVKGEFYPCKPDIFSATHDAALSALEAKGGCPDCASPAGECCKHIDGNEATPSLAEGGTKLKALQDSEKAIRDLLAGPMTEARILQAQGVATGCEDWCDPLTLAVCEALLAALATPSPEGGALREALEAIEAKHYYCVKCGKHGDEDNPVFGAVQCNITGEWDLMCCGDTGNITDRADEIAESALATPPPSSAKAECRACELERDMSIYRGPGAEGPRHTCIPQPDAVRVAVEKKKDPRQPWFAAWEESGMAGTVIERAMFRAGYESALRALEEKP